MKNLQHIIAGNLIDGTGAKVRRRVGLVLREGRIVDIVPAAELPLAADIARLDLSRCTLFPPLVDCSLSLSRSPSVEARVRDAAEKSGAAEKVVLLERHLAYCRSYGVLGLAVDDPRPELIAAQQYENIDVRLAGEEGDFVRICYSPGIEEPQAFVARLSPQTLTERLAARGEKKGIVLANGPEQVAAALAAGCDAIEQGYNMGEENLRRMAREGVLWIPSLIRAQNSLLASGSGGSVCCRFSQRYVAPGASLPGAEAFWKKTLAGQLEQLRLARELGVITAVGTGAGAVGLLHGESVAEEMKLFLQAGYSQEETFRCASKNGARFFGMTSLGGLVIGAPATFLASRGTPAQLPRKLSYLQGLYVEGCG